MSTENQNTTTCGGSWFNTPYFLIVAKHVNSSSDCIKVMTGLRIKLRRLT